MKKNARVSGFVVGVMLVLGLTASPRAADKETRQMMADIRMLQEQTQQLTNLIAALNETIAGAVKTVNARVDAKAEEQAAATRKGFADQNIIVNATATDLRTLREKVDDVSVRLGTQTQEIDALRQIVTQLWAARTTYDPVLGPPDGAPVPSGAAALGMSADQAWQTAFGDYASGQYDLAVTGFQTYISTFPKSEKAADAQVTICNAYINSGKYAEAVEACDVAIRTYPSSSRLAEAYLKKGLALQSLKQNDRARQSYEAVVSRFPDSHEATLARQKLTDVKP